MLFFSSPQLTIHTDKTQSSIIVCWAAPLRTENAKIKVFSALSAEFMGMLINRDDLTDPLPCVKVSGFQKLFYDLSLV